MVGNSPQEFNTLKIQECDLFGFFAFFYEVEVA